MATRTLFHAQCLHVMNAFHWTTEPFSLHRYTPRPPVICWTATVHITISYSTNLIKMRKSQAFGTKSMPLKKMRKNMRKGKLIIRTCSTELVGTAMSAEGELDDLSHCQHEQANATPVEQIVHSTESPKSQAASNFLQLDIESSSHEFLEPESTAVSPPGFAKLAPAASTVTSLPALLDLHPSPSDSRAASTTSVLSPTTLLFPSGRPKPLDFPGLDVLPPARV